jgi:hypothetical protein
MPSAAGARRSRANYCECRRAGGDDIDVFDLGVPPSSGFSGRPAGAESSPRSGIKNGEVLRLMTAATTPSSRRRRRAKRREIIN